MTTTARSQAVAPFQSVDARRGRTGRLPVARVETPSGERKTLAELAREATYEAVQTLRRCVNDKHQEMNVRCRAAGYLLQLGWGAAPKEATLRLVTDGTLAGLNEAELIAHAMERFAGSLPAPVLLEGEVERDGD